MVRPRKSRFLRYRPRIFYFKPRGVPLKSLEEVVLFPDEWEALKLCDTEGLRQQEAAKRMKISQPTFQRTLRSGHKKIADALVSGKAIKIEARG